MNTQIQDYLNKILNNQSILFQLLNYQSDVSFRYNVNFINNYIYYSRYNNSDFGLLSLLCEKYGTDKGSMLTSISNDDIKPITGTHNYSTLYEVLFSEIKNSVNYVFECGIGGTFKNLHRISGASLRVWRDYFHKTIECVYGADINENFLFNEDKIKTYFMDQTSKDSVINYFTKIFEVENKNIKFDIMIDDGLHELNAAICLFENSIKYLNNDGYYIIEDINSSTLIDLHRYLSQYSYKINYFNMSTLLHRDNNIIVIKK